MVKCSKRGIAQLVRACVLYTQCPWFESKYPDHGRRRVKIPNEIWDFLSRRPVVYFCLAKIYHSKRHKKPPSRAVNSYAKLFLLQSQETVAWILANNTVCRKVTRSTFTTTCLLCKEINRLWLATAKSNFRFV